MKHLILVLLFSSHEMAVASSANSAEINPLPRRGIMRHLIPHSISILAILLVLSWLQPAVAGLEVTKNQVANSTLYETTPTLGSNVTSNLVAYVDGRSGDEDIYVAHLNESPVVVPGNDQTTTRGVAVTLDGTGSSDPNGDPISYSWMFTTVPAGNTATIAAPNTASKLCPRCRRLICCPAEG